MKYLTRLPKPCWNQPGLGPRQLSSSGWEGERQSEVSGRSAEGDESNSQERDSGSGPAGGPRGLGVSFPLFLGGLFCLECFAVVVFEVGWSCFFCLGGFVLRCLAAGWMDSGVWVGLIGWALLDRPLPLFDSLPSNFHCLATHYSQATFRSFALLIGINGIFSAGATATAKL